MLIHVLVLTDLVENIRNYWYKILVLLVIHHLIHLERVYDHVKTISNWHSLIFGVDIVFSSFSLRMKELFFQKIFKKIINFDITLLKTSFKFIEQYGDYQWSLKLKKKESKINSDNIDSISRTFFTPLLLSLKLQLLPIITTLNLTHVIWGRITMFIQNF